jgi:transposase
MSNLLRLSEDRGDRSRDPKRRRGVKPNRNREIISGVIQAVKVGCRWVDCHRSPWILGSSTARLPRPTAAPPVERVPETQATGRSRGGRTTKIYVVVDQIGRILAFQLTGGQRHDVRPAAGLIEPPLPAGIRFGRELRYRCAGVSGQALRPTG